VSDMHIDPIWGPKRRYLCTINEYLADLSGPKPLPIKDRLMREMDTAAVTLEDFKVGRAWGSISVLEHDQCGGTGVVGPGAQLCDCVKVVITSRLQASQVVP
jgi:hypothetical protein